VFLRDSDFTLSDPSGREKIEHITQRNPQARLCVAIATR
jgi:hypothetical protein